MKAKESCISIVLPIYNGAKYMRQSIDSCLNQTHRNIELIIVDDFSTDETPEIIKSYSDPRIKAVRNEKNLKLPGALNAGFALATGEYLTWTSHDNYYNENALERMLAIIDRDGCDFAYADMRMMEADGSEGLLEMPAKPVFTEGNPIGACFLYKRKVMDAVGAYDTKLFLAEDYDYWIRVSKKFRMCHVPECLYNYRHQPDSLTEAAVKQNDVQLLSVLVRLKNGVIDISKATSQIMAIMEKVICNVGESSSLRKVKRKMKRIRWNMKRDSYASDVAAILATIDSKSENVGQAKARIKSLIYGK